MDSTESRGFGWKFWCVGALVAIATYAGSYAALVRRDIRPGFAFAASGRTVVSPKFILVYYHEDQFINKDLKVFFRPIHSFDRKFIRANYWDWRMLPP